jgi:hypothetical protein
LLQSLSTFSIAVVPSRWENLPYTCIEAMATGLPVLVSPNGGMSELIGDGDSGWVARDGSPDGLAEALRRALSVSPAERAAMGARASEAVRRMCANDIVVSRHLEHRSKAVRAGVNRLTMRPEAELSRQLLFVEETHRASKLPRRRYSGMALIQNPSAGFAFAWFLAAPLREKARWISRIVLHPRRIVRWIGWQMRQRVPKAFSLLLCTVKRREVRLFLGKSHVGSGRSVCTRSENASPSTGAAPHRAQTTVRAEEHRI